jgi:ATP-binding protein involved in chromosome partitioning
MAAAIAAKSAALFRRLDAPVLGVVENMGEFICSSCGASTRLFAGMSGEELSRHFDAPFLGSVPFDPAVGEASNAGRPAVVDFPESRLSVALNTIAKNVAAQISIHASRKPR